jgi:hypothetical protein
VTPATREGFDADEEPLTGPRLTFRRAETIEPTKPEWVWDRWQPAGALALVVSRQGFGKTTFATYVIGNVSTGRCFPDDPIVRDPVTCGILSLEEPADRLVARLHATGADITRVLIVGDVEDVDNEGRPFRRPWRLPQDCAVLERLLGDEGIRFLVVDGLGYSVTGDSHNYGAVGQALSALAGVAERSACGILGLTHPPKGAADPMTAAIGSTAWTAVARVVWVLGIDPEDDTGNRRVVRVSKSNFKLPENGLAFSIGDDERWDCGYVTGLGSSSVTAEDLVVASVPAGERTEREEARDLVKSILQDGPMDTAELLKLTRAAGVSDRTVVRARHDLGVKARARHDPTTGKMLGWSVELPTVPTTVPALPLDDVGTVGTVGTVVTTSSFSPSFSPSVPSVPTHPSGHLDDRDGF